MNVGCICRLNSCIPNFVTFAMEYLSGNYMIISDDSLNKKTIDIGTDYLISLFVRSLVRSFIHAFIHLNS